MKRKQIAVIGGGASGLMAAIQAAYIGADVAVLERNPRVGKKILSTGNGKCNFSHRDITAKDYYGSLAADAERYLQGFSVQDTLDFFVRAGMMWKDKSGYLYPFSEQASVVADVLRYEAGRLGIEVITDCLVEQIRVREPEDALRFSLYRGDTEILACEKVIAAFGGMAAPVTGSDGTGFKLLEQLGISCEPLYPALTKLICSDPFCKALAGVRSDAAAMLFDGDELLAEDRGEVQFTDYGLSGIPIFQISRRAAVRLAAGDGRKGASISKKERSGLTCIIDLFPERKTEELEQFLLRKLRGLAPVSGEVFLNGLVNKKLCAAIGKLAGIRYADVLTEADADKMSRFAYLSKHFTFHVTGVKGFDQAQVTAGGIGKEEVTSDLESVKVKGLFLAGELLDIDGKCGGYNLQWAWSSGAIAGRAAAKQLEEEL